MSDAVWLGVLAVITTMSPLLVSIWRARVDNVQKNNERQAGWDRDDEIAERLAAKVSATASDAAVARNAISHKLSVVQTLVNGNITDFMQRELDSLRREISLLEELGALKLELKRDINPVEAARLDLARAKLGEMIRSIAVKTTADAAAQALAATEAS